ncbi:hypothetical protein AVEN_137534-1 [Araneus ventricosus]|uniref:CUB domain-containing protein n=1 Tax=Araneus ventricosus TaxID=182803 RepID=A0A4Y2JQR9_ARAVE|nr:hypothetical protein AVEN_137534-1 [Araneus ventricosus]
MANGKSNPAFVFIWMVLMGLVLHDAEAALKTTFIEDLCYNQKTVKIDLRYQPTGILLSLPQTELSQVFDCEVILSPPRESSVVVSIYRYDIGKNDTLTIEDSDRFRIALKGYGNFVDEKKAFISDGRMVITYRRKVVATAHQRQGFQFTFTAVKKNGPCYDNEFQCTNRLCILKKYVCDGHNHCGDGSDQKTCVPKDERVSNARQEVTYRGSNVLWISIIGVSGAIVFIIVIVFIVVVVRSRKPKALPAPNSTNQNSGGNAPLQSVSSTVPQQQPHAPTTDAAPSAPPAPEHEGYSFYNRVRRSIRGLKNRKPEDVPKEMANSEVYQVPSMYPNLDQHEAAPSEDGIVNPEFKIEE